MPTPFRYIYSGHCDAVTNMAIDEYLFDELMRGDTEAVLRIYGWRPASLSLGRSQASASVDRAACEKAGIPVVRRMTGGGAIFHDDEITYSICARSDIAGGSVKECYRFLCGFIIHAYRELGLAAAFARELPHEGKFGERNPVCFAAREEYDIVVNGYKIGGNAQRWKRGFVFQHGSIPFTLSPARYNELMSGGGEHLGGNTRALADHNVRISFEDMAALLKRSFAEACDAVFVREEMLTSLPGAAAAFAEKYSSEAWTWDGAYGS
ncbi:MAG: lipoate--protein ligase family protein [Spirochaetota bacterium]